MGVPVGVALAAGVLILGAPVLVAATTSASAVRAAAAADAAALAAADSLAGWLSSDGAGPCAAAEEIARLHSGRLAACEIDESTLEARITVTVSDGLIPVSRKARAGHPE